MTQSCVKQMLQEGSEAGGFATQGESPPIPAWLLRPLRKPGVKQKSPRKSPTELELSMIAFCVFFLIYTTAYEVGFVEGQHRVRAEAQAAIIPPTSFAIHGLKGTLP